MRISLSTVGAFSSAQRSIIALRAVVIAVAAALGAATLHPSPVRAEDANHYGQRGRTILSAGGYAFRARIPKSDAFDHDRSWGVGARLTMVHFVVDNLAIGGTLVGSAIDGSETRSDSEAGSTRAMGLDVDAVWHVPLAQRLSLRFWGYGGVRHVRDQYTLFTSDEPEIMPDGSVVFLTGDVDSRRTLAVFGLQPQLLVHLSSSVALGVGPLLSVGIPVSGAGSSKLDVQLDAAVSYSFGPDADRDDSRSEDAAHFSTRGRTALGGYVSVGDSLSTGISYVEFVKAGLGVGVYVVGGATRFLEQQSNVRSAGAGIQVLADVPLYGSMSLMVMPQGGFLWQGYRAESAGGAIQARELQLTIPIYLTLHLHDAVVIGFGPDLAVHKRFHDTGPESDSAPYVRGGLSSVLLASF